MRSLLSAAVAGLLLLSGCDALSSGSSDGVTPQLVGLTFNSVSDEVQEILDGGGEIVWEVQSTIGRVYASHRSLPARVPANEPLVLVVADATTCSPKCDVLQTVAFDVPGDSSVESFSTDGTLEAELILQWSLLAQEGD